jgi:hypothetical protein
VAGNRRRTVARATDAGARIWRFLVERECPAQRLHEEGRPRPGAAA